MTFWEVNRKKAVFFLAAQIVACVLFCYFYSNFFGGELYPALGGSVAFLLIIYQSLVLPAVNSFKVINRLLADTSSTSILPLFDPGYEVGFKDKESRIGYTLPNIHGKIAGLPVVVYYTPPSKYTKRLLEFRFYPMMRPDSSTIFEDHMSFIMRWVKRLEDDIKPEVREFVADLKQKGYYSAEGVAFTYKKVDSVADKVL